MHSKRILTLLFLLIPLLIITVSFTSSYSQGTNQTILLKQGFNFISFTVNPSFTPIELKQNNSALIEDLYLYSTAAGSFLSLSDGTLSSISAGKGYIVKSKAEGVITISGTAVTTVADVSLKSGFNLIGISVAVAAESFSNLMKKYAVIKGLYKWSAAAGSFFQVVGDSGGIIQLVDGIDPQFKLGESYFININGDSVMSLTGNAISLTGGTSTVKVTAPVISPTSGTYTSVQNVTITTATSDANIHYTTDGSTPTVSSAKYSAAITVSSSLTIKAIAIKTGMIDSDVSSAVYTISIVPPIGETITLDLGGGVTLEMVKINTAGKSFQMGSSDTEQDRLSDEGPVHTVSFTKDFYIGKYEVTQAQWLKIYGSWPSSTPNADYGLGDNCSAYRISWDNICGANGFLDKINALAPSGYSGFRLPTEAEWEYAARGGTQTRFYWGDDLTYSLVGNHAWYNTNSSSMVHTVGNKLPNLFGLYDMSGNVWEWCSDWYGSYSNSAVTDPTGPVSGVDRVFRGGGWYYNVTLCRSASRGTSRPSYIDYSLGFRLARSSSPAVTNSSISPTTSSFNKNISNQQDVTTTMTLNGNTLNGIKNGNSALVVGTDYTVSGNVVTINKSYLALQTVGTTTLTFDFSAGADLALAITVTNTSTTPSDQTITLDLGGGVILEMVKINAAGKSFRMGSPNTEQGRESDEGPVQVSFTKDYYIGKYEVTQAQWLKIYGRWANAAPTAFYGIGDNCPVYWVSWDDISTAGTGFLAKLNQLAPGGYSNFRLPTEAEWEYAARGGTQTRFYWGDDPTYSMADNYAWHKGNSGSKVHTAGDRQPNLFGLYDMSGNVWEWCSDWYGSYSSTAITNPVGPNSGSTRVARGGSWDDGAGGGRSAFRTYFYPEQQGYNNGFRLVLSLGQ